MLDAKVEDIKKLGDYLDAFMSYDCLCVVGNEEKIKENQELFMKMEHLSKSSK